MKKFCYFDNNATTRIAPEVVEAMLPFLREMWGNPSSAYGFGSQVGKHIDQARERAGALIHADPKEVVFTSCGTESNNAAIHSALTTHPEKRHVVTTAVEHSANIKYCEYLRKRGCEVTFLPVESDGSLDLHLLDNSIRPDTAIVSVMWANNETGSVSNRGSRCDLSEQGRPLPHGRSAGRGEIKIDVKSLGVDYLSLSAQTSRTERGGLLYVRRKSKFQPYLIGGHQERGRRGGTENVAGIVAFGKAAELALEHLDDENTRVRAMRDRMEKAILAEIPNAIRNGGKEPRLPNTSNISFQWYRGGSHSHATRSTRHLRFERLRLHDSSLEPSHVLTAMGVNPMRARGSVRFSLGIYNDDSEVDYLLEHLPGIVGKLRALSPATDSASPVAAEVTRR